MFEAPAGAFGFIGPASPVFDQCTRVMQIDPFGLVDQPLQLGPLCFDNRTLIVLIQQGGWRGGALGFENFRSLRSATQSALSESRSHRINSPSRYRAASRSSRRVIFSNRKIGTCPTSPFR